MNPKYRALLWEECRVGGSLALVCLAVGMVGLAAIYYGVATGQMRWNDADSDVFFSVFGAPLILCLVLTSQTANSGQLSIEFSPRILRLPVETRTLTGLLLFTRLAMVMIVAGLLSWACFGLLGHGVFLSWFLLAGVAYLYVQTMAWLYRPAPSIAFLGYGLLGVAMFILAGPASQILKRGLPTQLAQFLPALLVLGLTLAAAYGASVWAVGATRRGARLGMRFHLERPTALPWPGFLSPKRFSTPFAAQVWWEIRTSASFLPFYTFIAFLLIAGMWIVSNGMSHGQGELSRNRTAWLLEWGPLVAILIAGFVCAITRSGTSASRKTLPSLFPYLRPLTSAELASARLAAHAISVTLTLLAVTAISARAFLFANHAESFRMLSALSSAGIMTPREIACYLFSIFALCGLLVWASGDSRTGLFMYLVTLLLGPRLTLIAAVLLSAPEIDLAQWKPGKPWMWIWFLYALLAWVVVVFVIAGMIGFLSWIRKRNLFPPRHLLYCVAGWAVAALVFFPFGHASEFPFVLAQIALSLALGAIVVLPYPALTVAFQRTRYGAVAGMNADGHFHRPRKNLSLGVRVAAGAGLAVVVVALAWFRWPGRQGYETFLRTQGWPVTTTDLAAMYPPVPPEKNLALRYLEIGEEFSAKKKAYVRSRIEEDMRRPKPTMEDPMEQVLVQGKAEVEPGSPIPESIWNATHAYYDTVARDTANQLLQAARSGLAESRYPISFESDPLASSSYHKHISTLRYLSHVLELESLMASVENRPGNAVDALLALLPLANSLSDEPNLFSQRNRMELLRNGVYVFEEAINRIELPTPELARLKRAFSDALPSGKHAMKKGLMGECVSAFSRLDRFSTTAAGPNRLAIPFIEQFQDLMGTEAYMKSEVVLSLFGRSGMINAYCPPENERGNSTTNFIVKYFLLPFTSRDDYIMDWNCRVHMGQALTACAVEDFRLAHGNLPENLQALVPEFLVEVPVDPVNDGKPLSYKVLPNGGYTIYSVGLDRVDDGGVAKKNNGWYEGDLAFKVAPPAERHPPRIAHEGSAS